MKRALLIAGGTVGGLGAVLAITPPQLSTTSSISIAGGSAIGTTGTGSSASASSSSSSKASAATTTTTKSTKPVATKKATAKATATKSATATAQATASASATATPAATKSATATPTATKTTAAVTSTIKDGTFTGPTIFVNYGNVQVRITVSNGKITDAVAVKAPNGRNDRYTNMAIPILKQQTLHAQSANIQGASGASYTSYGWFKSLQGALADAGF